MREFAGKTAFVTGGASGIGLAMGRAFAEAGMKVMLADIETEALASAVKSLHNVGPGVRGVICDVGDAASVEHAAQASYEAFGNVHVVCNNAGVAAGGLIGEASERDWNWVVDVNLMGVVHGVEIFAPLIAGHGEGGHFVNTASIAGMISPPGLEAYSATKFAVVAMSEGWAIQLAPQNIGVSILCPGFVKTRIHESRRNRPAAYGPDEHDATPDAALSPVLTGIPTEPVGARVVEAVRDNDLYVFTHPEFRAPVAARFERILAAFDKAEHSPALAALGPRGLPEALLSGG